MSGASARYGAGGGETQTYAATAGGILFAPTLLMLLFREKYPRWWFEWNQELVRFGARIYVYLYLLDDRFARQEIRELLPAWWRVQPMFASEVGAVPRGSPSDLAQLGR